MLETDRLRLRAHRLDDLDARTAMTGDPATMRFIGGAAQDREENHARILRYAGQWALYGHGALVAEERAGGRFAGEIGLGRFCRGLGEDFDRAPEAMWVLAGWATGRGYAGEAMRAAIAWHARAHGPQRMVCIIHPDNAASLALAARLGFRRYDERPYRGRPTLLLERDAGAEPAEAPL